MVSPWVRTPEALASLARTLEGCRAIGLDSESDSLYHHFEKVCLLQLATDRGEAFLVDTLALADLAPLAPVMADPGVVKVLHGADYDVTTLKRDFGLAFASIFDTMIAARLLGRSEIGLAAVVRDELGIALSKGNQKDDWSRRPLTPEQEAYALADVRHLVALHERLGPRLAAAGRLDWLAEECAAVAALDAAARRRDPDAYLGLKGARRLPPRSLAALRELHAWRERRAEETDTPAFRILGNESLLRLAETRPRDLGALAAVPGVLPRLKRQADALLAAVRRAEDLPEADLPRPARPARPVVPDAVRARVDRLRSWRAARAAQLGVEVSVVLPQRLIDRLAETAPRDAAGLAAVEGLRRWRAEAFGRELLAAVS
ncbi:MAG TPA: HRDC domain-containing protein [Vicinamibacteria bacterium]